MRSEAADGPAYPDRLQSGEIVRKPGTMQSTEGSSSRPNREVNELELRYTAMERLAIIVAVALVGIGVKVIFFTGPNADADSLYIKTASVDVFQLQQGVKDLEAKKFHDMSLVFSSDD